MSSPKDPGFDRLRPRSPDRSEEPPALAEGVPDHEGKRALFSAADQPAATGGVTIECSSCGARSVVSARQAVRLALPSFHLPLIRRQHGSWMRCPACRRRTWVRLDVKI